MRHRTIGIIGITGICIAVLVMLGGVSSADNLDGTGTDATLSVSGASGSGGAFTAGDTHAVSLTVSDADGRTGDIYIGLILPDGSVLILDSNNAFTDLESASAWKTGADLGAMSGTSVFSAVLPPFLQGQFGWAVVVAEAGTSLFDMRWIAYAEAGWTFSGSAAGDPTTSGDFTALVVTRDAGYAQGAVSTVSADRQTVRSNIMSFDGSDNAAAAHGGHGYVLRRYGYNSVIKLPVAPVDGTTVYEYSGARSEDASDPNLYDIAFASDSKAYLIRYQSSDILVVDPSASSQESFITGSIDISGLTVSADTDGTPDPIRGVVSDGKLYVLLQHTDSNMWARAATSAVAVIDTTTDTLVDTDGDASDGVTPVTLGFHNAQDMQLADGYLWIAMVGDYGAGSETTGVQRVDLSDLSVETVLDGGGATLTYGASFNDVAMVSATKGYVSGYVEYGAVGVHEISVDASGDGTLLETEPVSSVTDHTGIEVAPDGTLWILATDGNGGVVVLDPETGSVSERVAVGMIPEDIAFIEQ